LGNGDNRNGGRLRLWRRRPSLKRPLILIVITVVAALEQQYVGPCRYSDCVVKFASNGGKTVVRIEEILDEFQIALRDQKFEPAEDD
jgi:hypothetical protein